MVAIFLIMNNNYFLNNNIQNTNVELSVQLGATRKSVKDILQLGEGSILELDKNANEPVTIFINNIKYAEGEVVSIDENFGVKVTKIFTQKERLT